MNNFIAPFVVAINLPLCEILHLQSIVLIIKLKISDLVKDSELILLARNEAIKILKNDPSLSSKENLALNRTISKLELDKSFWNLVS